MATSQLVTQVERAAALQRMWFGFIEASLDLQVISLQALASATQTASETLSEAELEQINLSVWRLQKAIDYLTAEDFGGDIAELFECVFGSPDQLVEQILTWTDIIHTLMQEAERSYGGRHGYGRVKARRVKAAVLQIARRTNLDIPKIPAVFEPFIISITMDMVLKVLVKFQNRRGDLMWGESTGRVSWLRALTGRIGDWIEAIFGRLMNVVVAIVWKTLLWLNPLPPELQKVVDKIVTEQPDILVKPMVQLTAAINWVVDHTDELEGLFEAFAIAVEMAEDFLDTGSRKKVYARELIIAFLEQSFIPRDRSVVFETILRFIVDATIEMLVHLFRKQGVFAGHLLVNLDDHATSPPVAVDNPSASTAA